MTQREKTCYCHTCEREFHSLGIARHRAAHRDRHEDCDVSLSDGVIYTFKYASKQDRFLTEVCGGSVLPQ